jgi:hypothetical protein
MTMLFARSPEECHYYMELHPCECGEEAFDWSRHQLEQRSGRLVSVYLGGCGRCGVQRRFEFEVTGDLPPPPAFGRDEPSRIIDPGEFLSLGRRAVELVPDDPAELSEEDLDVAYGAVEMAVAAVAEVLKFVPAGADAVPGEAMVSPLGRALYARGPEEFDRVRLEATMDGYRRLQSRYAAALDGLAVTGG